VALLPLPHLLLLLKLPPHLRLLLHLPLQALPSTSMPLKKWC
jgi:hypothetical protein